MSTLKSLHASFSLVQWIRLYAPRTGGLGWISGHGPRSHMLQLKSMPHVGQLRPDAAK